MSSNFDDIVGRAYIGVKHSIIFIIECTWESINLHECVDFRLFRLTTHYFIGEIYLFF